MNVKKIKFDTIGKIILMILVTLLAIIFVMPLYWMLTGSFKKMVGAMKVPPDIIPLNPTLQNYVNLFTCNYPVLKWMLNSIIIASVTTFLCVLICSMMGYAFGKKDFPGKNAIFLLVLVTIMLPKQSTLIPLYFTVKNLKLINNLFGAILPMISWPYGIFLMRQFMQGVPDELIESANIEGAHELTIFWKIVLPLCKPAVSTLAILMFMNSWGDFMWQLIVLKKTSMWTMNVGMSVIIKNPIGGANVVDYGLAMAGATFGSLPVIFMFISFQKYFVKGITVGAVKQ